MIELDGSFGEGGGALVRTALALSAYTGKSFEVKNIRAGRKVPGLKAQHLSAIEILKELCDAKTNEIAIGTTSLRFIPNKIKSGIFEVDIGTAGSISLVLQALILPSMFAPGKVTLIIKGGTCGKWQASVDYIQNVLFPHLQRFAKLELKVLKRGYFPRGGGEVKVEITPHKGATKIVLEDRGDLEQVKGRINLSKELEENEVGERILHTIKGAFDVPTRVEVEYVQSDSIGGDVILWAVFGDGSIRLGANSLVEKRKSSEEVGKAAVAALQKEIGTGFPVDHFLADQLIPFMGLLPGSIIDTNIASDHLKTNIYVVEKFLPIRFTIKNNTISSQ